MPRSLMDKLGHFLVLIFLIQIQFVIKGSNAIPGNVHASTLKSDKADVEVIGELNVIEHPLQFGETVNEPTIETEITSFDLSETIDDTTKMVELPLQNEEAAIDESEVTAFEGWDAMSDPRSLDDKQKQPMELELIVPKVRHSHQLSFEENSSVQIPHADRLAYSMLASSYPLRPKTFSRQSVTNSEDNTADGLERGWILDINSEISGSSRIAKLIYSSNSFVVDKELQPISFDFLCSYLEANIGKKMCEDELLLICKRIVIEKESLVKAFEDLPLFIRNHEQDCNASSIYRILNSYLGHSEESFKQSLYDEETDDNGCESSRCSGRESDFSFETNSVVTSQSNSPTPYQIRSPPLLDDVNGANDVKEAEKTEIELELSSQESLNTEKVSTSSNSFTFSASYLPNRQIVRSKLGFFPNSAYVSRYTAMATMNKDFGNNKRNAIAELDELEEESGNETIEEVD